MTLIQQIYASSRIENLDDALRPLQEILGVTDGGHASMFWTGPFEEAWPHQTGAERRKELLNYIDEELAMAF